MSTQFPITFDAQFTERLENPVNQVIKLLKQARESNLTFPIEFDATVFSGSKPEIIERIDERTPQARENESKTALYVWQPTDSDVERVTADGTLLFREDSVEILIYVLEDEQTAVQLQEDLLRFFSKFIDDNKTETRFNDIQPSTLSDNRPANIPRDTSHDVMGVTIDLNKRQSVA